MIVRHPMDSAVHTIAPRALVRDQTHRSLASTSLALSLLRRFCPRNETFRIWTRRLLAGCGSDRTQMEMLNTVGVTEPPTTRGAFHGKVVQLSALGAVVAVRLDFFVSFRPDQHLCAFGLILPHRDTRSIRFNSSSAHCFATSAATQSPHS